MENTPMKVKLLMHDCDGPGTEEDVLVDFYIKADRISGWFVPFDHEEFGAMLSIFIDGNSFGIKQEPHVLEYLENEFVKPLKKVK